MTDIIATAKVLARAAVTMQEEAVLALCNFAPDMASSLAEETYEYACEIFTEGAWELSAVNDYSQYWGSEDKAGYTRQFYEELGEKARIARRRVSPTEVVG